MQVSIKVFEYQFTLNDQKKVPERNMVLRGVFKNYWRGVRCLIGGWKCFIKKGGLLRKGWRKNTEETFT